MFGFTSTILHNFDKKVLLGPVIRTHCFLYSSSKDRDLVIKELREKAKVFNIIPGRYNPSFPRNYAFGYSSVLKLGVIH